MWHPRVRHSSYVERRISRPQAKQNSASCGFRLPQLGQNGPRLSDSSSFSSPKAFSISVPAVLKAACISFPAAFRALSMESLISTVTLCVAAPHFEQKLAPSGSFAPHLAQNGIQLPPSLQRWGRGASMRTSARTTMETPTTIMSAPMKESQERAPSDSIPKT